MYYYHLIIRPCAKLSSCLNNVFVFIKVYLIYNIILVSA